MCAELDLQTLAGACPDGEYQAADYLDIKIYLVSVCGTTLAVVSVIENILLLYLFITRSQFRTSPIYYMMYLAFCDIFVSFSYIFLMSLHVISEYFQVIFVAEIRNFSLSCCNCSLCGTRTCGRCSPFRTSVWPAAPCSSRPPPLNGSSRRPPTSRWHSQFHICNLQTISGYLKSHRPQIAIASMCFGLLSRGTVFFELMVVWLDDPRCAGFASVYPTVSLIASVPVYIYWKVGGPCSCLQTPRCSSGSAISSR